MHGSNLGLAFSFSIIKGSVKPPDVILIFLKLVTKMRLRSKISVGKSLVFFFNLFLNQFLIVFKSVWEISKLGVF